MLQHIIRIVISLLIFAAVFALMVITSRAHYSVAQLSFINIGIILGGGGGYFLLLTHWATLDKRRC